MRTLLTVLVLLALFGAVPAQVTAQEERPFIFQRTCKISAGQNAAAASLARKFIDLYEKKFPGAFVGASQSIMAPFNIRFVNTHPDLATYQSRVERLLADEAYRSLIQMAAEAIDPGSCVDELSRAVP